MRRLRQFHRYLGVLFAPAIVFFAFSGVLQTFDLHEDHTGRHPPAGWIVTLASVHKDQRLPPRTQPNDAAPDAPGGPHADHDGAADKGPSPLPLKIFVAAMGVGLALTALMGVFIALQTRATRSGAIVMLALGMLLPIGLLFV